MNHRLYNSSIIFTCQHQFQLFSTRMFTNVQSYCIVRKEEYTNAHKIN
nr:MAG TPA: hypothetical protein [Caudoviricetes sp.]